VLEFVDEMIESELALQGVETLAQGMAHKRINADEHSCKIIPGIIC
jgi:hypothetical protein